MASKQLSSIFIIKFGFCFEQIMTRSFQFSKKNPQNNKANVNFKLGPKSEQERQHEEYWAWMSQNAL